MQRGTEQLVASGSGVIFLVSQGASGLVEMPMGVQRPLPTGVLIGGVVRVALQRPLWLSTAQEPEESSAGTGLPDTREHRVRESTSKVGETRNHHFRVHIRVPVPDGLVSVDQLVDWPVVLASRVAVVQLLQLRHENRHEGGATALGSDGAQQLARPVTEDLGRGRHPAAQIRDADAPVADFSPAVLRINRGKTNRKLVIGLNLNYFLQQPCAMLFSAIFYFFSIYCYNKVCSLRHGFIEDRMWWEFSHLESLNTASNFGPGIANQRLSPGSQVADGFRRGLRKPATVILAAEQHNQAPVGAGVEAHRLQTAQHHLGGQLLLGSAKGQVGIGDVDVHHPGSLAPDMSRPQKRQLRADFIQLVLSHLHATIVPVAGGEAEVPGFPECDHHDVVGLLIFHDRPRWHVGHVVRLESRWALVHLEGHVPRAIRFIGGGMAVRKHQQIRDDGQAMGRAEIHVQNGERAAVKGQVPESAKSTSLRPDEILHGDRPVSSASAARGVGRRATAVPVHGPTTEGTTVRRGGHFGHDGDVIGVGVAVLAGRKLE